MRGVPSFRSTCLRVALEADSVNYRLTEDTCMSPSRFRVRGPSLGKSRKLFASGKQFVKLQPAYSVKLVLSYVVKGVKIKITAKFRTSRRLRFEDTKTIIRPKSFGTFEKLAPGPSKLPAAISMVALHLSRSSFILYRSPSKLMLQFVRVVVAGIK